MERTKKSRTVLRTVFTKLCTQLKGLIEVDRPDIIEIKAVFEVLVLKFQELQALNTEIYDVMLETDISEKDLETEIVSCDDYATKFSKMKIVIENLEKLTDDKQSVINSALSEASLAENKRKFKLPKLELQKFSGDVKEWLQFWSQFKRVDEDNTIEQGDKFQYLLQATLPKSRAREIVESFPPTADNYPKAVESLKARFGREDLLVEVYVRELLRLVLKNTLTSIASPLASLYDKLECHLRSLETLGVTTQKCASMLFPLVESCLPEDLLRVWQRSCSFANNETSDIGVSSGHISTMDTSTDRLNRLMTFIKVEVENEERIALAKTGFGVSSSATIKFSSKKKNCQTQKFREDLPTAAGLLSTQPVKLNGCPFCDGSHKANNCIKAQNMTLFEKMQILSDKSCCYVCFRSNHFAKKCRLRVKCIVCGKGHQVLMCPNLPINKAENVEEKSTLQDSTLASFTCGPEVYLQTLRVILRGDGIQRSARAIIDSGSQRSYILKSTAAEMEYKPVCEETIIHSLFGGQSTGEFNHYSYQIHLSSLNGKYRCNFQALDQPIICGNISSIKNGPWLQELKNNSIYLSDVQEECKPIEILIGADVAGKLLTGKHKLLSSGLVAVETLLGWTLMGKVPNTLRAKGDVAMTVISMFVKEATIEDLWKLDVLGITEPSERKTNLERQAAAQQHFIDTVTINSEGRFEVHLPWLEGHAPLPSNYNVALKRLNSTIKRLNTDGCYEEYQMVFNEWLRDGIIEEVPESELCNYGHYLPHRHVVKENSTTIIRPVFDASAREGKGPSLNDCLEKGPNLIELIPSALWRFRLGKIGVISDIKKAFLQISLYPIDRNYLRFLWKDKNNILKVYRHCRVVFGVTSSPFLLGAVIQYYLQMVLESSRQEDPVYSNTIVENLLNSFYVDNCIVSLDNEQEVFDFMQQAVAIMNYRKFELRGWETTVTNGSSEDSVMSKVLGLNWNRRADTLEINSDCLKLVNVDKITKRTILSAAHKVFDPIGFTCPVSLCPKLLLRTLYESKINWDQVVNEDIKGKFLQWVSNLSYLMEIKIPRWLPGTDETSNWSLHTFCDASQLSYGAVVYLRVESFSGVRVQLIQAKSRVTPLKKVTIPRLELLAALIAARLHSTVMEHLRDKKIESIFWTDSTTVLAWMQRNKGWGTFVWNRIEEIKKLTYPYQWHHVPGSMNPTDLPSRGCTAKKLLNSKWWQGPNWLKNPPAEWPTLTFSYNEIEINEEKRKMITSSMLVVERRIDWYYRYFSKYEKIVNLIGWVLRFVNNCRHSNQRITDDLTLEEVVQAELLLMKFIQNESFVGIKDEKISCLCPFIDDNGILRLKTTLGEMLRSVQRLYPLEISSSQDNAVDTSPEVLRKRLNSKKIQDTNKAKEVKETRSGRKIKVPIRLGIP